ncbi:MAG TPA: hypothetical protein DCP68_10325 [Ruminococcus sp.]|nr:hypothetical protein [Ruminococcus sp.]
MKKGLAATAAPCAVPIRESQESSYLRYLPTVRDAASGYRFVSRSGSGIAGGADNMGHTAAGKMQTGCG